MKSFLIKSFLFVLPVVSVLLYLAFLADGNTDPFYLRFTSPRQQALVIGSSRSSRGILPSVLNHELNLPRPIYNFSFNAAHSPYGEIYFKAIQRKLEKDVKNSLFVVSVDPWSIAADIEDPENPALFPEKNSFLDNLSRINTKPNFLYLIQEYRRPYSTLLTDKLKQYFFNDYPELYLHEDGWLEEKAPKDSATENNRTRSVDSFFETTLVPSVAISRLRKAWLIKTIAFLQEHGRVYLVRIPVHPGMLAIENRFCPGFNSSIDSIARRLGVPYCNFMDSCTKYRYTDGSHMRKSSAALLSLELSRFIRDNQ